MVYIVHTTGCPILLSKKTKTPVDLQIFDYKQCFDSLWLEECMNDVYSAGLNDDKFQLLFNANTLVNVAVKTPVGKPLRNMYNNNRKQLV